MKHYYTEKDLKELVSHIVILHAGNEQKNDHVLDYFESKGIKHKKKALRTGDYSFMIEKCPELGFARDTYFTDEIVVERKFGLKELAGNIAEKNERFLKEINRMINIDHVYLFIENDSLANLIEHRYDTKYNELAFLRQILAMQKKANIYINFVDKEHMGKMIYEVCYSCLMNHILK